MGAGGCNMGGGPGLGDILPEMTILVDTNMGGV